MSNSTAIQVIRKGAATILAPALTTAETTLVQARSGRLIRTVPKKDLNLLGCDLISMAYFECRWQTPQAQELALMGKTLATDLQNNFFTLYENELKEAIKNGTRKVYGDFAGISNATIFQWIAKYYNSVERQAALKKQNDFLLPPPKELTPAEKQQLIHEGAMHKWERFKKSGRIIDPGNVTYNYLVGLGIINYTIDEKREIQKAVREKMANDERIKLENNTSLILRDQIRAEIDSIEKGTSPQIVLQCQKEALLRFFQNLYLNKKELKDLFEKK